MTWAPPTAYHQLHKPFTAFLSPCKTPALHLLISCSSTESCNRDNKGHYHSPSRSQQSFQKIKKNHSLQPKRLNQRHKRDSFVEWVKEKKQSDATDILQQDGDWSKEQFWDFIRFLRESSRTSEILQAFDLWKDVEKSRINEENYVKIISLLFEDGLTDAAILALKQVESHGIRPSLEMYNVVIHGFARAGRFEDAVFYLEEMMNAGLKPDTETYDGLIQSYGKYGMYDEIGRCLREMESSGCLPDYVTYNLLIREFAKAGLLNKMESTYSALLAKRMDLQNSTLVAMLEAYANFGILDKMEKVFRRVLNSKAYLKDDLIRRLARVYIEKLMFSRLEDLGLDLSSRTGSTDLVWCLRLLSHACTMSKKGMYFIIQEMESSEVPWNVTTANIMALAYLKMKDFTHLEILLSELPSRYVKPDIVTVGVLFDAIMSGFRGNPVKRLWTKTGFFDDTVEMNTDALVLIAFGKGKFLKDFEEMFPLFEAKTRNGMWTYRHLIDSVKTRFVGG
ncbi:pentatricopeptide repeat-containing protein At4g14190, chloroplastic [Coffea eugenioides]|uniref:pentatricopeptide repeat-containing protein At4g14190, chloroplastic n=1 Tax=Coffea eugenioides TaxID=49369 RepID=UPI000F606592|nr:pentatricopeptide repeat-containing protein At4g14190, chloroplastic [Coffea eugenioides]